MKIENLNLSALKYFIDAVEHQSITKSSQLNHVSRPAVSQAILRLEVWYGKALLEHEKRSFNLTPQGKIFFKKAKTIFENLQQDFAEQNSETKTFKMGCSFSLLDLIFPQIEPSIKDSLEPVIKIGRTAQLIESLKNNEINLAYVVDSGQSHHLHSLMIRKGHFQILSQSGKYEKTLITTEERNEVSAFKKYALKKKLNFTNHIQVESWTAAIRLAQLNLGCCLVPDFIHSTGLIPVRSAQWGAEYKISLLTKKNAELSPLEQKLLDLN